MYKLCIYLKRKKNDLEKKNSETDQNVNLKNKKKREKKQAPTKKLYHAAKLH